MNERLPCITLNKHAERRLLQGHPWIFSNEVGDPKLMARQELGGLVEVLDCHGDYVGTGFINPNSLISIRILSRQREEVIDQAFFQRKIEAAIAARDIWYGPETPEKSCYRAVFGESDGLPGLVLDRFSDVWVAEPHAAGMHVRKEMIRDALLAVVGKENVRALVWRTDSRGGALEGIHGEPEVLIGDVKSAFAYEDGVKIPVDVISGQKTGFFFDQRENRKMLARWIKGRKQTSRETIRVLDCFCHAGGWGIRALRAGADHVTFVDSSAAALEGIRAVVKELGREADCEFIAADAEKTLKGMKAKSFDAVVVDPPAFITSRKTAGQGLRGYFQINQVAAALVKVGGVMSSSSCSHHAEEARFEEAVGMAVRSLGREPKILWRGGAAPDHPAIAGMAESRYLKNFLLGL